MKSANPDDRTILSGSDPEFIAELSEYLDVLASPVRLRILSFLGRKPRTVRQVSREIETSYENTKKHLARLLSLGLIKKEIGVSEDPGNQGQPVFYYSLLPGCLAQASRNLAIFTSVSGIGGSGLSEKIELCVKGLVDITPGPVLFLVSGPECGRWYELRAEVYRMGRGGEGEEAGYPEPVILLGDGYRSVSRVCRPHAWIRKISGIWMIEDGMSRGGTYVNNRPISHQPVPLAGEDRIELSPGSLGATLLFRSTGSESR